MGLLSPRFARLGALWRVVLVMTATGLVLMAAVSVPHAAGLTQDQADEFQVKAAFLYNFTKFVQWPTDAAQGPIVIGLAADDSFGDQLSKTVKGRQVNGRELVVRYLKSDDEARACQVVFVSEGAARRAGAILSRLTGTAVLTVGESQAFLKDGGHIRFYVEQNRVRFQISAENAERAGLKISAQLMSLSKQ